MEGLLRQRIMCSFFHIYPLSPCVKDQLKFCLAKEVELYSTNVQGTKCRLCPFRTVDRVSRLQNHINTTVKKTCMSDLRSPQLSVIRAYYGYCQSTGPITPINIENLKMLERTGFAPQ